MHFEFLNKSQPRPMQIRHCRTTIPGRLSILPEREIYTYIYIWNDKCLPKRVITNKSSYSSSIIWSHSSIDMSQPSSRWYLSHRLLLYRLILQHRSSQFHVLCQSNITMSFSLQTKVALSCCGKKDLFHTKRDETN